MVRNNYRYSLKAQKNDFIKHKNGLGRKHIRIAWRFPTCIKYVYFWSRVDSIYFFESSVDNLRYKNKNMVFSRHANRVYIDIRARNIPMVNISSHDTHKGIQMKNKAQIHVDKVIVRANAICADTPEVTWGNALNIAHDEIRKYNETPTHAKTTAQGNLL